MTIKKNKITILLPDLRGGGAERVGVNLANSFIKKGYVVDMVLLKATGIFLAELASEVNVIDLKAERIRFAFFPLVNYLRTHQPDAVIACMWPLTVIAQWARFVARTPTRLMVAEHTTWSRSELVKSFLRRLLIRTTMHWVFPRVDNIVTVSNGAADDLATFANINRKTITTIYNPVVGEKKHQIPQVLAPNEWWQGTHYKVLAVGTLKTIKDYSTLLKAFALLHQTMEVKLLILGEGECRAALEQQASDLGIAHDVFMPGFALDTTPYYHQADLHVLSSTGEGLPTVIIEALAAGTPVVSTDCPSGPREILADGQYGRLVPVGDAQALAAAMAASLTEKTDSAALKARAQDFSIDKVANQYLGLLFPQTKRVIE